jgi:hypothetical protein
MIDDSVFEANGIDKFLNTISIKDIPLINVIIIDNNLYGRLDIIINTYYNGNMQYLPLLMAFNKITDPTEIVLGQIFELPDIDSILEQILITQIIDDENGSAIPGINNTTNSSIINKTTANINTTNTVASPKLKISLEKISYDANSGILKF